MVAGSSMVKFAEELILIHADIDKRSEDMDLTGIFYPV